MAKASEQAICDARVLFQHGGQPILCLTPEGSVLSANPAWLTGFSYTREGLSGLNLWDLLVTTEAADRMLLDLRAAASRSAVVPFSAELRTGRGGTRLVSGDLVRSKMVEGAVAVVALFHDQAASSNLAETRHRLIGETRRREQLESALAAVNELAAAISSQLMSIRGHADTMMAAESTADETEEAGVAIRTAVAEVAGLLADVESLMPLPLLDARRVQVAEIVDRVVRQIATTLPKGASLRSHVASELWQVDGDVGQLETAVTHLVGNAIDAVGENGRVEVLATNVYLDEEHRAAHGFGPGEFVEIDIIDNGVGIPDSIRSKVFSPFVSTKPKGGLWRGFGLAQVQGIATRHRGFVCFESHAGEGTTFSLLLPRSRRRATAVAEPHTALGHAHFLIIDDEPILVRYLSRQLAEHGHSSYGAAFGYAGIEYFREHHAEVDFVLVDVRLGDTNGIEVTRQILDIDGSARVILTSGVSGIDSEWLGTVRPDVPFIKKPFEVADLFAAIGTAYGMALGTSASGHTGAQAATPESK